MTELALVKLGGLAARLTAVATGSGATAMLAEGVTVSNTAVFSLITGSGAVIALLFKLLMASKEREFAMVLKEKESDVAELNALKVSYQKMAADALHSATEIANFYRQKEGNAPLIFVPPVVPESQSPSTELQRETAHLQTMLANLEHIKREQGLSPKPEPPHAVEVKKP